MEDKEILHTEFVDGQKRYSIKQFSLVDELRREDLEDDPLLIEYARLHGFPDIVDAYRNYANEVFRRTLHG